MSSLFTGTTPPVDVQIDQPPQSRSSRSRLRANETPYYVILALLVAFAVIPIGILVSNSLKTDLERGTNPLGLPQHWAWENFTTAWTLGGYQTTMTNSLIFVVGAVLGVWVVAGCAAYAMSHLDLPGASVVLLYLVTGTTIPLQVFLVPLFFLWSNLNLYDTRLGLIIIYIAINAPFSTLLLRSFMVTISKEFRDAARIDGANELQVFLRVMLPLSWPGFLTIGLTTTIVVWNEFILAQTFIQSPDLLPVQTSLFAFHQQFTRNWGLTNAGSVIAILPIVVLFLIFQRRFIAGLAAGGLKG